jgi:uncharacterized membrane protein
VVGVVAGRNGWAVELVEVVVSGFGYAVEMTVGLVEVVGGGFGYAVEMAVEPHTLVVRGCLGCITSLRALLAPC